MRLNVAARLEQAAAPSEILLGEETFRLVRDAVQVEPVDRLQLKGKSRPVRAFRLLSVDPVAPGIARRFDVPLVGRQDQLALLAQAWRRVVRESGCHLFTSLGAAGVGVVARRRAARARRRGGDDPARSLSALR